MKEEKVTIKNEIKDELREASDEQIRPQDLNFDENIDDKYTSEILKKHQNGNVKNKWFSCSGILSILFGVLCILSIIIAGISFIASKGDDDYRNKIVICSIVFSILGILSILVGIKIKSFSRYDKAQLIDHLGTIVAFIVLQFFFGGMIFAFLTLAGYFVGIGSDYGAIYYNRIDNLSQKQKKLADAKALYQNELIDYEEYINLKNSILNSGVDYEDDYYNRPF